MAEKRPPQAGQFVAPSGDPRGIFAATPDRSDDALAEERLMAAVANEREAIAKLIDKQAAEIARKLGRGPWLDEITKGVVQVLRNNSAAIRARAALKGDGL